jgi:hypothetical protein
MIIGGTFFILLDCEKLHFVTIPINRKTVYLPDTLNFKRIRFKEIIAIIFKHYANNLTILNYENNIQFRSFFRSSGNQIQ